MDSEKEIQILVVDDAMPIRMAAKKILNKLGYPNISLADDGTTALDELKARPFDLVIADWNMKQMSGLELLAEMRADDKLADIPFLLVTGEDDQEIIMEAIKAGINGFMTKPYKAKDLSEKIDRIFSYKENRK